MRDIAIALVDIHPAKASKGRYIQHNGLDIPLASEVMREGFLKCSCYVFEIGFRYC